MDEKFSSGQNHVAEVRADWRQSLLRLDKRREPRAHYYQRRNSILVQRLMKFPGVRSANRVILTSFDLALEVILRPCE